MGKHFPDIQLLPVVMNRGDQTGIVAADVEYRKRTNIVRRIERMPDFREIRKAGCAHQSVPRQQGWPGRRMLQAKNFNRFPGDDMHEVFEL
nr:hypothetical protein [Collimonas sp. PA-H2]